ncbi:MAG: hypothetical protein CMP21_03100 [Rickettsiales bacterium]|nr:hypothetical protein [Rickettsiales bacterium]|tara:strand:- start:8901 stop:10136 length:1236 start_codon:yes stop_codon:yes gene_type:complete
MKQLLIFILCLSFTTVATLATTKTLPKGVIKADVYVNNFSIETLGANPSGDRETWTEVSLKDGKMSDIYLLNHINNNFFITYDNEGVPNTENSLAMDTKLVTSWEKQITHLDLAYGLTDKITLFANLSYEKAVLDYTDGYFLVSETINSSAAGELSGYNSVPDKATADNMNDIFVGVKVDAGPVSVAYKGTDSKLMVGHDSLEKKQADRVQELETSRGYSQHHFYLFKDIKLLDHSLEFTTGFIALGTLTQDFLDIKSCEIRPGSIFLAKANLPVSLSSLPLSLSDSPFSFINDLSLNSSYTVLHHRKDYIKGGNSAFSNTNPDTTAGYSDWTAMPKSSGFVHMANLELVYQPAIFVRAFVRGNFILANDTTGQFYNFPGRIQPGNMILFGVTLFAKNPFVSGAAANNDEY